MKKRALISVILSIAVVATSTIVSLNAGSTDNVVSVNIDTSKGQSSISPYIYGVNQDISGLTSTARRLGGNRLSGYNWETNASNAGSDYIHSNDNYLPDSMGIATDLKDTPGMVGQAFHNKSLQNKVPYSLVTLQAAGYVSADKLGAVKETEVAPSSRWKEVKFAKNAPFSLTPDLTDDYVYMDEYVNSLVSKFGKSNTATGIKGYSIDNEPGLWVGTHPRMHPKAVTCEELITKSIALSKAVKNVDPYAEIFGPALYGFNAFVSLQDAPDWKGNLDKNYKTFIEYYLDQMKKNSDKEGKRLLDVLDIHYYSEAQGGGMRVTFGEDPANVDCNKARLQAPRTLWQSSFTEDSWITKYTDKTNLPILPVIQKAIDTYNKGTKLAVTEYDFGAGNTITGGLAQADTLGIFAKNNVYFASYWGEENKKYIASAMNLYTNYDGQGSTFGNTNVQCEVSNYDLASAYASINGTSTDKANLILINKNYDTATTFEVSVSGDKKYTGATVYGFDRTNNLISKRVPVSITNNKFSITMPALSAYHLILDTNATSYGDMNKDGKINSTDSALMIRYILGLLNTVKMPEEGDLNLDGLLNTTDVSILDRYIFDKISSLPYVKTTNTAPVAAFTIGTEAAVTDSNIEFDASTSTDSENNISYYYWDYGNGKEGLGKTSKFKYAKAGTYTVKLIVGDAFGLTSTITKTLTVTSATGDNSKITFESDKEGFYSDTSTITQTTAKAFKGNGSLKVDMVAPASTTAKADAKVDTLLIPAGSQITFRIWVPANAPISAIQAYCMPHDTSWSTVKWNAKWMGYDSMKKDDWNEFTFTLPEDTDMKLAQQVGIQVDTTSSEKFTLYIDAIDW